MAGLSYPAVRGCIDLFDAGGWPATRPALRGRNAGLGRSLTQVQEDSIQCTIMDKRPEQLKMDSFLWSRAAVGLLIEQEYGISMCAVWANISSARASHPKSQSSAPMRKTRWRCRRSWRVNALA